MGDYRPIPGGVEVLPSRENAVTAILRAVFFHEFLPVDLSMIV